MLGLLSYFQIILFKYIYSNIFMLNYISVLNYVIISSFHLAQPCISGGIF